MALVILAILVVAVAIDTFRRFDRQRHPSEPIPREQSLISTQKIIVDLSKRL